MLEYHGTHVAVREQRVRIHFSPSTMQALGTGLRLPGMISKAYLGVVSGHHGAESQGAGAESRDVTTLVIHRKQREQPGTRVRLSILNSCPWYITPPGR